MKRYWKRVRKIYEAWKYRILIVVIGLVGIVIGYVAGSGFVSDDQKAEKPTVGTETQLPESGQNEKVTPSQPRQSLDIVNWAAVPQPVAMPDVWVGDTEKTVVVDNKETKVPMDANDLKAVSDALSSQKAYYMGTIISGGYVGSSVLMVCEYVEGPSLDGCSGRAWFLQKDNAVTAILPTNPDERSMEGWSENNNVWSKKMYPFSLRSTVPVIDDFFVGNLLQTKDVLNLNVKNDTGTKSMVAKFVFQKFVPDQSGIKISQIPNVIPNMWIDNTGTFLIPKPAGFIDYYEFIPVFAKDGVQVTFTGEKPATVGYSYNVQSCFSALHPNLKTDLQQSALTQIGIADNDPIFVYKDQKNKDMRAVYDQYVEYLKATSQKIPTFDVFLKKRPVFFWQDPLGRWIQFTSNEIVPMAECGKPVIYLYPTHTEKISVRVKHVSFSKTEPSYDSNGWTVTANPNGQLINDADGKKYPYLFWEGTSDVSVDTIQNGFSVAQKDISSFLDNKLSAMGLSSDEISDFKEFWLPRMQTSPYYVIRFYGTEVMNTIAPLSISPRPDSVLRIFMDFQPASQRIEIAPQLLPTFKRQGFSVVEWGGSLRR